MPQPGEAVPCQDFSKITLQVCEDEEKRRKLAEFVDKRKERQQMGVNERQHEDQQASRILPWNGAESQVVRTWLQQRDLPVPYSQQTVCIAAQIEQGDCETM